MTDPIAKQTPGDDSDPEIVDPEIVPAAEAVDDPEGAADGEAPTPTIRERSLSSPIDPRMLPTARPTHPSEMRIIELSGYRLDGNIPVVTEEGELAPETRDLLENQGDMPRRRILRAASLAIYIVSGFGWTLLVSDYIDGSLVVIGLSLAFFCVVCGWLDEVYIQPLTRTAASVGLRFGASAIRYNEGVEIGYLNYSDIDVIYLFPPLVTNESPPMDEFAEAKEEYGLLIVEDVLGKRMCVTDAPLEKLDAAVARLRAATPELEILDYRAV